MLWSLPYNSAVTWSPTSRTMMLMAQLEWEASYYLYTQAVFSWPPVYPFFLISLPEAQLVCDQRSDAANTDRIYFSLLCLIILIG